MYTPLSRSGRRTASDWKTKASISIPVPAITQAISAPSTPVAVPNSPGRVKTPPPTIEPTTMPARVRTETFWTVLCCPVVIASSSCSSADVSRSGG